VSERGKGEGVYVCEREKVFQKVKGNKKARKYRSKKGERERREKRLHISFVR